MRAVIFVQIMPTVYARTAARRMGAGRTEINLTVRQRGQGSCTVPAGASDLNRSLPHVGQWWAVRLTTAASSAPQAGGWASGAR